MNIDRLSEMVERTNQVVDGITDSVATAMELAVERMAIINEVTRTNQKMAAYEAIIESLDIELQGLAKRADAATGAMKKLMLFRINCIIEQQTKLLHRIGAVGEVKVIDETPAPIAEGKKVKGKALPS